MIHTYPLKLLDTMQDSNEGENCLVPFSRLNDTKELINLMRKTEYQVLNGIDWQP